MRKHTINRLMACMLAVLMVLAVMPGFASAAQVPAYTGIRVTIDGERVHFPDQHPVIVDGRTLVPVRGVFEAMGFDVDWDGATRTAILRNEDYLLHVPVGAYAFTNNGRTHRLDVPAQLINDRTMLPIRFLVESVGFTVGWDDAARTVTIETSLYAERFRTVYRTGVVVVEDAPRYSHVVHDETVVITFHNANDQVRRLQQGDTFAIEPTAANPGGMSGHVTGIAHSGAAVIITARLPRELQEIFYEFHVSNRADLLGLGAEIVIAEEFRHIPGISVGHNRTAHFFMQFRNAPLPGATISGRVGLHHPIFDYNISFNMWNGLDIRLMEMSAGASINIRAEYQGEIDRIFEISRIRVPIMGVFIEIPFGFRLTATGEAEAVFDAAIGARFGIHNNNPFFERTASYGFTFDFYARLELMLHVQMEVRILGILEVYAVFANLGVGLESNTAILNRCPQGRCFVLGSNVILRLGSVRNFGAARAFPGLNFGPVHFTPNMPVNFHYFTGGRWRRACPHRLEQADVYVPLLGEWQGIYTGSDGGRIGLRGITMSIFHDGFNYRVLANIYPVDGGLSGRIGYYGIAAFNPVTRAFHMQGNTLSYNPYGIPWSFIHFDGHMNGGILLGTNRRPGSAETGPFSIIQTAAFDPAQDLQGAPMPGFVILPAPHHVTDVTVTPETVFVPRGSAQRFGADVHGIITLPNDVRWSVTGAASPGTFITETGGILFVAPNETAARLTVRASSALAPDIIGTAEVSVGAWALTAAPQYPDFGIRAPGYAQLPAQTITVRNTGTAPIVLDPLPVIPGWTLTPGWGWRNTTNPGATRTFAIRPNTGLPAGTHTPFVPITASGGAATYVRPHLTVQAGQWSIEAAPFMPDFPAVSYGYAAAQVPAQTITITNTGNQPITLEPLPVIPGWVLVPGSRWGNVTNPGGTRTFTIRPDTGLPAGVHTPIVTIRASGGALAHVVPQFTVLDGQWNIEAAPFIPDFGEVTYGYTLAQVPAQNISIRNTGNQPITLDPLPVIPGWTLVPGSDWGNVTNPGGTRTFTLRPNTGLPAGAHTPIITVSGGGAFALVVPHFIVAPREEPETLILNPTIAEITARAYAGSAAVVTAGGTAAGNITFTRGLLPDWVQLTVIGNSITAGLGAGVPADAVGQNWIVQAHRGSQTANFVVSVNIPPLDPLEQPGALVQIPAAASIITNNSIAVNPALLVPGTGQSVEYAIGTDRVNAPAAGWQTGLVFDNLQPGTTYFVWARSAASATHTVGTPMASAPINTTSAPAEVPRTLTVDPYIFTP